ncbi:MAG: oligoendopeptidase F [Chlamydiota bacterium]|jgi:oligoendopeptidase F
MVKERSLLENAHKWDVSALYPSWEKWEQDLKSLKDQEIFQKISSFKGTLSSGEENFKKFLDTYFEVERTLDKLYTYAHLRLDEDLGNDESKEAFGKIVATAHEFQFVTSWVEPEIIQLPDEKFQEYLNGITLAPFKFFLEKIHRLKPHTLTLEEEKLIALSSKTLDANHKTFSAFNDADLQFDSIKDSQDKVHELTNGLYSIYLRNNDRVLRKNAFEKLHEGYLNFENTLCELLQGQMQNHLYLSRARKYPSCLEAALFVHNVDPKVYHNLIASTHDNLSLLHKYMEVRKKRLKVDTLQLYDLYVPIVEDVKLDFTYQEACQLVVDSVAPLGKEYQNILREGLNEKRWVDPFENLRKRSGAYSSGCYDSNPYILMNFHGTLNDVLTLAHEAGHSMHSYLSRKNQPYHDAQYPIFVAEVASTFNEQLLLDLMLKQTQDPKIKAYLLNYKIEGIRTTFFRQTMFAEFELQLHTFCEKQIPFTPSLLKEEYKKLNQKYFGPTVHVCDDISIEWARIPHFYYNFYVYQYATGISAAYALFKKVRESDKSKNDFLNFLSSGGKKFPLDLLKVAGVDMTKEEAVQSIFAEFSQMLSDLDKQQVDEDSSLSIS